jgi:hypothetical protein
MGEKHDPFEPEAQLASEAEQVELTRLLRAREVDDFKWLMGHRQGRSVVWRLLGWTRLHHTPHVMGASSEDNAFRAGAQNIGQQLQAEIYAICPERYTEMQREYVEWLKKHQP